MLLASRTKMDATKNINLTNSEYFRCAVDPSTHHGKYSAKVRCALCLSSFSTNNNKRWVIHEILNVPKTPIRPIWGQCAISYYPVHPWINPSELNSQSHGSFHFTFLHHPYLSFSHWDSSEPVASVLQQKKEEPVIRRMQRLSTLLGIDIYAA